MKIKLLLLFALYFIGIDTNAQRRRSRSYEGLKQGMLNTTVQLSEIRTYLNEKSANKVNVTKTITFTEDSVIVITNNTREAGTWVKGNIDFILITADGKQIKYDWLFGREDEPCFQVGNNKKTVECYRRIK
jgi:hypothetical protein